MSTRVSGQAPQSTLARMASLALGAGAKKGKAEDKKDDDKAEDKEDDKKSEDKKEDDKAADKKDGDDENCAEDDEDMAEDDEDEDDKKESKKARAQERQRIKAILQSEDAMASEAHYANAAYLAFETNMSAKSAIGMLRCMPAAQNSNSGNSTSASARERLSRTPSPRVEDEPAAAHQPGSPEATAALIIAAGEKRRGEKK